MGNEIKLELARAEELDAYMTIIEDAKSFQQEQGFVQWNDEYPTRELICEDIATGKGYALKVDGKLAGYMCVHFDGEEIYEKIRGQWKTQKPYGVMHRMAFDRKFRGRGLTEAAFSGIEELCRERGIYSLRVDTDPCNKRMQHVFEKCGFTFRGLIEFQGDKRAYDKDLREKASNYDKVIESWRKRFLSMDAEKLIQRFHLKADEEALYLTYFSRELRIDRSTGEIRDTSRPEHTPGFNTVMTVYNMFHYAVDCPRASGTMVPFREVKRVYPFEAAYKKTILSRLEKLFSGHAKELRTACERLRGIDLGKGDAGYLLPVFPFLNIAVFFWEGDEEFPPQANMLFDSNITDFVHEENVVGIAADAVYYLAQAAGIETEEIYAGN